MIFEQGEVLCCLRLVAPAVYWYPFAFDGSMVEKAFSILSHPVWWFTMLPPSIVEINRRGLRGEKNVCINEEYWHFIFIAGSFTSKAEEPVSKREEDGR